VKLEKKYYELEEVENRENLQMKEVFVYIYRDVYFRFLSADMLSVFHRKL